ncbi:MAG: hypothetical protein FJ023_04835 [Chloroflexi bacterium]|nr:hypothetical protein [Chloroflexota bacterium]
MEHIVACPTCNKPNRFGEPLCGFCGQNLAYRCAHCHVDIDPSMTYCPHCGETSLVWSIEQSLANDEPSEKPDFVLELN